jgi:hypothetical protein
MLYSPLSLYAVLQTRRVCFLIQKASLVVFLSSLPFHGLAQKGSKSDQKIEKEFYSAKDRLQAIRNATIFSPKAVSEADIMQGPSQDHKQFQLR